MCCGQVWGQLKYLFWVLIFLFPKRRRSAQSYAAGAQAVLGGATVARMGGPGSCAGSGPPLYSGAHSAPICRPSDHTYRTVRNTVMVRERLSSLARNVDGLRNPFVNNRQCADAAVGNLWPSCGRGVRSRGAAKTKFLGGREKKKGPAGPFLIRSRFRGNDIVTARRGPRP